MFVFPTSVHIPIQNHRQYIHVPDANTTCTITLTGITTTPNIRHVIHNIQWSYGTTTQPTNGRLFVTAGTNTIFDVRVTAAGPGGYNLVLKGDPGETLVITLAAGGSSVQGTLNAQVSEMAD